MRNLMTTCGVTLTLGAVLALGLTPQLQAQNKNFIDVASARHTHSSEPTRFVQAPQEGQTPELTPAQLAEKAYVALEKNCASCHGVGKRQNRRAAVDRASHKKLIEEQKQVVPGKPLESHLYTSMLSKDEPMPPPNAPQKPTAEEIETIRLWIEKGAPAPVVPEVPAVAQN
jgi:mono/diheme cytochrome c family protein